MITKSYIDAMMAGITIRETWPANPQTGDVCMDPKTFRGYIWVGNKWEIFSSDNTTEKIPTEEQLEKHPALKQAWEEYMIVRKLLGI